MIKQSLSILSLLLFFLFRLSTTAGTYHLFRDSVNYEVEGIKGLNPQYDRIYYPEWNPENDPVYEPLTTTSSGTSTPSEKLSASSSPAIEESASITDDQNSVNFDEDVTTGSSMISPLSVVSVASEANIKTRVYKDLYIPKESRAPLKLWRMRSGSLFSKEKFSASICHLEETLGAINELGLPKKSVTYSLVSHRFRNINKLNDVKNRLDNFKIECHISELRSSLELLGSLIEKKLKDDIFVAVQLVFDGYNTVTIKIVVNTFKAISSKFNVRAYLAKPFKDLSY